MQLEILDRETTTVPGGQVAVRTRITNDHHTRRERVILRLIGVPPGWVPDPTEEVELQPTESIEQTFTLRVGHNAPRARNRIGLRVDTASGYDATAGAFDVDVDPTDNVDVRVEPRVDVGGRGHYIVSVRNDGDRSLSLKFNGEEVANECDVTISPASLQLRAGEQNYVEMSVSGGRLLVGGSTPRPITVTMTDSTGERWRTDAHLRQSPVIPRWLIVTLVVTLCAIVAIAILVKTIQWVRTDEQDPEDASRPPAAVIAADVAADRWRSWN